MQEGAADHVAGFGDRHIIGDAMVGFLDVGKRGQGVEYFFYSSFLRGGLHAIDYLNFRGTNDLRLAPEFGISLLVILNISYCYQIPLSKDQLADVSTIRVSLKVNLGGLFNHKLSAISPRGKKLTFQ